ncbi:MAG: WG repeat-containing protein [Bacteroidaceae bacterium]|nr:WG repeat-containing protein [Bacteroidaceae bacterium]
MQSDLGFCTQCGAQGRIGNKCEYCGSTISASRQLGNYSMIESWGDYHFDGFSIVSENVEGNTDFPEFQVIKGDRTGYYGLIDRYGNVRIPCIYDYLMVYLDYNLCSIAKDYRHAIFNTEGQIVVPFEEANPLGLFLILDSLIFGYNTVYDLQGNLKVKLPTNDKIILLSNLYASTIHSRGLYSLENGEALLSTNYKVEKIIGTHLVIVSKVFDGFTRYGIFNCLSKDFVLKMEYSSIQEHGYKDYIASSFHVLNNGTTKSNTLTFTISSDNRIVVEKEELQTFQTPSGNGCMLLLLLMLSPLLYFFL